MLDGDSYELFAAIMEERGEQQSGVCGKFEEVFHGVH
jgi:hypothetical protein